MNEEFRFWFVHAHATDDRLDFVRLAVAAQTERSARRQARKELGPTFTIEDVDLVTYPHAWVLNLTWSSKRRSREPASVAAVREDVDPPVVSTRA